MDLPRKKDVSVLLLMLLLLMLLQPCLNAKAESISEEQYLSRRLTSEEIHASMEVIEAYLQAYHWAFYYLEMPKFEMVVYNDDTAFHLERLNFQLADYKAFDSSYDAVWGEETILQTSHIKQNGQYEIVVYDSYDYHYKDAPADVESGCGLVYTFLLEVIAGEWKITGIQAEDDDQSLEYGQAQRKAVLTGQSIAECLHEAFGKRIDHLPQEVAFWKEQSIYFAQMAEEQAEALATQYEEPTEWPDAAAELRDTGRLTYNRVKATEDALYYAERSGPFKRMSADCINFVSQCIWAGFGGTSSYAVSNQSGLRNLIDARYRMTSDWYGISSTSSATYPATRFMRVVELWNLYCQRKPYLWRTCRRL